MRERLRRAMKVTPKMSVLSIPYLSLLRPLYPLYLINFATPEPFTCTTEGKR